MAAAASSKGRAIAGSFVSRVLAGKAASPRYWDDGNTNAVSPRGSFSFGLLVCASRTTVFFFRMRVLVKLVQSKFLW
jgi:hypothetical protein